MRIAKKGDTVKVNYTGTLDDGTVFDSSKKEGPLTLHLGKESVIPGFEEAVVGMHSGESKIAIIPPEKGFGSYHEKLLLKVDLKKLPPGSVPKEGQQLQIPQKDGSVIPVIVKKVTGSTLTVDANHPLAGRELTFHIELLEINPGN